MAGLSIRQLLLIVALTFGLGLLSPHLKAWFLNTPLEGEPTAPEQDTLPIRSDAFTLHLLHAATVTYPEGNITLAPNSLAVNLLQMVPLAAPEVEKALTDLPLPDSSQESAAQTNEAACLFADPAANLNRELANEFTQDAPFSQDITLAFRRINIPLKLLLGDQIGTPANSTSVNNHTNLLAFNGVNITAQWSAPVSPEHTTPAPFFNANGSMPQVYIMKLHARYYAEDPMGNWQAAAIRLARDPEAPPSVPDCYLILIHPIGATSARPMAAALTPELFSTIRTALRESTRTCTTALPRLSFTASPQLITPLLKSLQIDPLFTSATPFSKLTSKAPWPFTTAYQYCRIILHESPADTLSRRSAPQPDPESETFRCDRPFLWFLMPLSSPVAPYAAGVVENL